MKKLLFLFLLGISVNGFSQKSITWTGFISDANCGAKGSDESHAACAVKCVKGGAAPVLVVDKKVYKLADGAKVMDYVGKKVKVTGTIKDDTITIEKVEG